MRCVRVCERECVCPSIAATGRQLRALPLPSPHADQTERTLPFQHYTAHILGGDDEAWVGSN